MQIISNADPVRHARVVSKTRLRHVVFKTRLRHVVSKTRLRHVLSKTRLRHVVSKTRLRHEGGHPERLAKQVRRVAWIPAFAGTTFALMFGAASNVALAHTGAQHALSFASGFVHPLTGLDHMLAMVAVGLWAGLNGGRALWAWPVAFVGVMVLGGVLGMSGITLPMVESGILASVVVLGLLVLVAARLPVSIGAGLVAVFALLHGHAHGAELFSDSAAATYAAGFALATALLHAIGLAVTRIAAGPRGRLLVRGTGALVAAAGVALAAV